MWESYQLGGEELLWPGICFLGGISDEKDAPCGPISTAAVALGLLYRCPASEREKSKKAREAARLDAKEVVRSFRERFGGITCMHVGAFDSPNREQEAQCDAAVAFVLERLYHLIGKRGEILAAE